MSKHVSVLALIGFVTALAWMSMRWTNIQTEHFTDYPDLVFDPIQTMWTAFICSFLICSSLLIRLLLLLSGKNTEKETLIYSVQIIFVTIAMVFFYVNGPISYVGVIVN